MYNIKRCPILLCITKRIVQDDRSLVVVAHVAHASLHMYTALKS